MRIGGKEYPPPFEFWVPDYTDLKLPRKADGTYYRDPEEYEDYLNWLVVYLEKNRFSLNPHQSEIMGDPLIKEWGTGRLGLWLGGAAISGYYYFVYPKYDYPEDYLDDPKPERVCDPDTADWESRFYDPDSDDPEPIEGMIDLRTYLIFDCMCWRAEKEYRKKMEAFPRGTAIFSDVGRRPLLKAAIKKTDDWREKKEAIRSFHDEYAHLSMK